MSSPTVTPAMIQRGVVSLGDLARLQAVFARAAEGGDLVIGVIGGSITEGAAASKPENRYGNLVAQWWREKFPKAHVRFVNAGIGATGSDIGAHRVAHDLLAQNPDFVVVEFAVNDPADEFHARTYEGVLRQILVSRKQPAVMLLFMVAEGGGSAQDRQAKLGQHYGLPMVSYRDAVWPEIEAGRMKWQDISPDTVHPNDWGHHLCAQLITTALEQAQAKIAEKAPGAIKPLPPPLLTDEFVYAEMLTAKTIKPVRNEGWTPVENRRFGPGWQSDKPGSTLEFKVRGNTVGVIFWRIKGDVGRARAQVDDREPVTLEAWFPATWGGYTPYQVVASGLGPGEHLLRVTLLEDKNPESQGHHFELLAIACAGLPHVPITHARAGLPNVFARLKAGKPTSIAYIGGSITVGAGASNQSKCYRSLTTAWFRQQFPHAEITEVNAAIGGTGSNLGVFRLGQDVLAHHPHLVFVEFAVNDSGLPDATIDRAMEGIVRQIWAADPTTDICFVYTMTVRMLEDYRRGRAYHTVQRDEGLAEHYGIPAVNVGAAAAYDILDGKISQHDFARDGVHPTDRGYQMYLATIASFLEGLKDRGKPGPHAMPEPLTPDCWQTAHLVDLSQAKVVSGWQVEEKRWCGRFARVLASNQPGAELTLPFEGDTIGVYFVLGPDTGNFLWRVDDGEWHELCPFDHWARGYHRLSYRILASDLPRGKHTLGLRVSPNKHQDSKGLWTRIGYFMVK